jgi:hypothetical protein
VLQVFQAQDPLHNIPAGQELQITDCLQGLDGVAVAVGGQVTPAGGVVGHVGGHQIRSEDVDIIAV